MKVSASLFLTDILPHRRTLYHKIVKSKVFDGHPPQKVFTSLQKAGVEGIELLLPSFTQLTDQHIHEVKKVLETHNMPVLSIHQKLRFFTKTKFSHAGIIILNWDVPFINEAIPRGIIASPFLDKYTGHYIRICRPNFSLIEMQVARRANSKIGITGYDFSSLLWYQLIYQLTGHWFGYTTEEKASERMYCTEYIGWIYNEIFPKWHETSPVEVEVSDKFITVFEGKLL